MKKLWSRYAWDPFLQTMTEVPWFGPVFSAVMVALLVNIVTEALTSWGGPWLGIGVVAVMAAATIAFINLYARSESRRREEGLGPIKDLTQPGKQRGLVFLYSREDTLREAINYHRPVLEHCWLLVTPEMQDSASQAMGRYADLPFTLHSLPALYDSQACYQTVRDIYRQEAPRLGLPTTGVIADITGGTKPMTMGMIVACLEGGYPIEHIPTAFDATGKPTGPLPPIQIMVQRGGANATGGGGT